jgi:primosomal protein N' (replication factor Y)
MRRPGHWPPFGRLAALIVSSEDERRADRVARDLGLAAPGGEGVQVLGPAPRRSPCCAGGTGGGCC